MKRRTTKRAKADPKVGDMTRGGLLAALAPLMRKAADEAIARHAEELRSRGKPAEHLQARGDVKWKLRVGKKVVRRGATHNLVVDVGLNYLRDYPFNNATAFARMRWVAIGSNAAAPAAGDVALGTETARVLATYAAGGTGVVTLSASFAPGTGTGTVAEAGLFDNAGAGLGNMFDRFLLGPLTKAAGATLDVELTITFTAT